MEGLDALIFNHPYYWKIIIQSGKYANWNGKNDRQHMYARCLLKFWKTSNKCLTKKKFTYILNYEHYDI